MLHAILPYPIAILAGYLLGCSNMALYLSRRKGIDMRSAGSGNLGASNAVILMGWGAGVLVAVHDIGKGVLAVLLARLLFPDTPMIGFAAGVAAVLGHIFPFYLKFRGGKGFAAYIGVMLMLSWKCALVLLAAVVVLTLVTDFIVVGTVTTVVSFPVYIGMTAGWVAALILCAATLAVLYKHRENFVRILNGTEIGLRKAGKKK